MNFEHDTYTDYSMLVGATEDLRISEYPIFGDRDNYGTTTDESQSTELVSLEKGINDTFPDSSEASIAKRMVRDAVSKMSQAKTLREALSGLTRDEAKVVFQNLTEQTMTSPRWISPEQEDPTGAFETLKSGRNLARLTLEECYGLRTALKKHFHLRADGEPVLLPEKMLRSAAGADRDLNKNPWSKISAAERAAVKEDMLAVAAELKQREPESTQRVGTSTVARDGSGRVMYIKERDYTVHFQHGSGETPAAVMIEKAGKMRILVPCGTSGDWLVVHGNGLRDVVHNTHIKVTKDSYGVKTGKEWQFHPTTKDY